MKKIILSIIVISLLAVSGTASAASLFISPANSTQNAGSNISASVKLSNSGSKVCAVEGTLVFNNVSCQSITLSGSVTPQTAPTCSNPYFLVGIPSCTASDATLMTVSAKAGSAGSASISVASADIIGEGSSLGSAVAGANYTLNAIPVAPTQNSTPKTTAKTAVENKEQPKEEKIVETASIGDIANQTAALGGTSAAQTFFGWIWSNIIWIIVLAIGIAGCYVAGRATCRGKKSKNLL